MFYLGFPSENTFWTAATAPYADKKSMGFQASFKQILEEKLGQHQASSSATESIIPSTDPAHLAFLMSQVGRFEFQRPQNLYPRPKPRPRPAHALNEGQKLSYEFLKSWVHDLSEGFTPTELKRAFRQAALVLHPDHGGNSEQFMDLKFHYQILKSVSP